MTHAICIYCKAVAPTVRFNREHVVQNGFGKFREALVLHDAVCEPCNTFFSGSIDIALTRDSVEARGAPLTREGFLSRWRAEGQRLKRIGAVVDPGKLLDEVLGDA